MSLIAAAGLLASRLRAEIPEPPGHPVPARRLLAWTAGGAVVVAVSLVSLPWWYPREVKEWTYWHSYQSPFPYLFGRETEQDFLKRDVQSIYVYDYINAHLDGHSRILLLNDASRFYSRVPTLYSFTVEAEKILLKKTEEDVIGGLTASRITHVLLNLNGIAPLPGIAPRQGVYFFLDKRFQERYLEPVYSNNNVTLFRVRKRPDLS